MAALDRPSDAVDGLFGASRRSRNSPGALDSTGSSSSDAAARKRRADQLRAFERPPLAGPDDPTAEELRPDEARLAPLDDLPDTQWATAAVVTDTSGHAAPAPAGSSGTESISSASITDWSADAFAPHAVVADPGPATQPVPRVELPGGSGSAEVLARETAPTVAPEREDDTPGPVLIRPATPEPPPLPDAPAAAAPSRQTTFRRRRPRVRRVRRIVRSIDSWTVFKVSLLFYLVLYAILLVAGVLLWNLAYSTGTIDNLERFFESFGWQSFHFHGGQIFHSAWIAGLFLVAAGTGLNVVMATVFNLIADLVGGIGVTVLEEEVRIVDDTDTTTVSRRRQRVRID